MMQDAFEYGTVVTDALFIGRDEQIQELMWNINSGQNCVVYGDRRVGKSSLIHESIKLYKSKNKKEKFFCLYLDLSTCTRSKDFIELISRTLDQELRKITPLKKKFSDLGNFIKSIRPTSKINNFTGELEHSIDFIGSTEEVQNSLVEVIGLIESISTEYKILLVLDEFHIVSYWDDSDQIQWQIRSRLQLQKNISYIFSGSSRKLITKLFAESSSALYRSGPLIYVDNKIDFLIFANWIKSRFKLAQIKINGEPSKVLLDFTRAHPYYTQKLCYFLWMTQSQSKNHEIAVSDIWNAIQRIINNENHVFRERLEMLSFNQQNVLRAIAITVTSLEKQSLSNLEAHSRISKTSIQSAIKQLEAQRDQIIIKIDNTFRLEDPFFEFWLGAN